MEAPQAPHNLYPTKKRSVQMVIAFYDPFVYIQYVVPSSFFVVTLLATSCANVGAIKSALPLLASLLEPLSAAATTVATEELILDGSSGASLQNGSHEDILVT